MFIEILIRHRFEGNCGFLKENESNHIIVCRGMLNQINHIIVCLT